MMTAVIYARYSSDSQRESSIDDQVRVCIEHSKKLGYPIAEIYADKAISGSRMDRPEYLRMKEDGISGKFKVLIVEELSRLSRNKLESEGLIRSFAYEGVRVVCVSDGIDTDSKGYKIHTTIMGLKNELEIDALRERTHRGVVGQVIKGFSGGGKAYGYDKFPVLDHNQKDQFGNPKIIASDIKINEEQAVWVRQIFEWYANGESAAWISKELNSMKIPSLYGKGWRNSTILGTISRGYGILNNQSYIGKLVWNKNKRMKHPDTGKRKYIPNTELEHIVAERPDLRIIPQDLWLRAKERRRKCNPTKALARRAHLFSGIIKCHDCSSNFVIVHRDKYGCAGHKHKGDSFCMNDALIERPMLEDKLLEGIRLALLDKKYYEVFRKKLQENINSGLKSDSNKNLSQGKKLAEIEKEITNVMNAIKAGILTQTTKSTLEALEQEKVTMQKTMQPKYSNVTRMMPMPFDEYKAMVSELKERLREDIPNARQIIYNQIAEGIDIFNDSKGIWANLPAKEVMLSKVVGSYWCSGEGTSSNLHRVLLKAKGDIC